MAATEEWHVDVDDCCCWDDWCCCEDDDEDEVDGLGDGVNEWDVVECGESTIRFGWDLVLVVTGTAVVEIESEAACDGDEIYGGMANGRDVGVRKSWAINTI